jgi:hypothetical protein
VSQSIQKNNAHKSSSECEIKTLPSRQVLSAVHFNKNIEANPSAKRISGLNSTHTTPLLKYCIQLKRNPVSCKTVSAEDQSPARLTHNNFVHTLHSRHLQPSAECYLNISLRQMEILQLAPSCNRQPGPKISKHIYKTHKCGTVCFVKTGSSIKTRVKEHHCHIQLYQPHKSGWWKTKFMLGIRSFSTTLVFWPKIKMHALAHEVSNKKLTYTPTT